MLFTCKRCVKAGPTSRCAWNTRNALPHTAHRAPSRPTDAPRFFYSRTPPLPLTHTPMGLCSKVLELKATNVAKEKAWEEQNELRMRAEDAIKALLDLQEGCCEVRNKSAKVQGVAGVARGLLPCAPCCGRSPLSPYSPSPGPRPSPWSLSPCRSWTA
jgi:hypothetical protein